MGSSDIERMVNQIADFYRPYPRDEAINGVAEHITMFWEMRMRKELTALLRAGGGSLSELGLAGARAALGENAGA